MWSIGTKQLWERYLSGSWLDRYRKLWWDVLFTLCLFCLMFCLQTLLIVGGLAWPTGERICYVPAVMIATCCCGDPAKNRRTWAEVNKTLMLPSTFILVIHTLSPRSWLKCCCFFSIALDFSYKTKLSKLCTLKLIVSNHDANDDNDD